MKIKPETLNIIGNILAAISQALFIVLSIAAGISLSNWWHNQQVEVALGQLHKEVIKLEVRVETLGALYDNCRRSKRSDTK
jgi:hypothetical protein